jgi:hypothetical protein
VTLPYHSLIDLKLSASKLAAMALGFSKSREIMFVRYRDEDRSDRQVELWLILVVTPQRR